jgi:hypothetical protein
MNRYCELVFALSAVAMGLGICSTASASESELIQEGKGSAVCSTLTIEKIKELSDAPPPPSNGLKDGDGQVITYSIDPNGDTLTEFTSEKPVNIAILGRRGEGSRIFYYGEGVVHDTDLQAGGIVTLVRFCYGLSSPPESLPQCDASLCGSGDSSVVLRLDPDPPQWTIEACTCGNFERCDPSLVVGAEGACEPFRPDPPPFVPVPVKVEAGQDPWVCYIVRGKQKCYCQDSDSSKKGCQ